LKQKLIKGLVDSKPMKTGLVQVIAGFFIAATLLYLIHSNLFHLSSGVKVAILFIFSTILLLLGFYLKRVGK